MNDITQKVSIFDVANDYGVHLHGKGKLFSSPFRIDNKPSFSVFANGKLYKDFGTGEVGNVITFFSKLENISTKESFKQLLEKYDNNNAPCKKHIYKTAIDDCPKEINKILKGKVDMPAQLIWNDEYANELSKQRNISIEALKLAYEDGCFGFAKNPKLGWVWGITDSNRLSFQARKLDGTPWKFGKKQAKAWTFANSDCSYPVGLANAKNKKWLCLCEGGTDFLACYDFLYRANMLDDYCPLSMLGANQKIGTKYLKHFRNKKALIFPDNDEAGKQALDQWNLQLQPIADDVLSYIWRRIWLLKNGEAVGDLNDYLKYAKESDPSINPFTELAKHYDR